MGIIGCLNFLKAPPHRLSTVYCYLHRYTCAKAAKVPSGRPSCKVKSLSVACTCVCQATPPFQFICNGCCIAVVPCCIFACAHALPFEAHVRACTSLAIQNFFRH